MNSTRIFLLISACAFVMACSTEAAFGAQSISTTIAGTDVVHGTSVSVSTEGVRGIVVIFLSSKCPCSDSHSDSIKKLAQNYSEYRFVGIHSNADEPIESSRPYFEKLALPFPVVQDDKLALADRFKAFKTPHVFVLSQAGELLYQGGVTESHFAQEAKKHFLADALEALRNGKNPPLAQTRTLGCMITR
jgi:hypothetical protein